MKMCPVCGEVRFKIGIPVWPDDPDSIRVCSTRCARRWSKDTREDAKAEEQDIEALAEGLWHEPLQG